MISCFFAPNAQKREVVLWVERLHHALRLRDDARDKRAVLHGHLVVQCRADGDAFVVDDDDAAHTLVRVEALHRLLHLGCLRCFSCGLVRGVI